MALQERRGCAEESPWFLAGGGECGELIRKRDWEGTGLGPPSGWPAALQHALATVLASLQPMSIVWGERLLFLYNDAFREFLGSKHPHSMGRPVESVWSEVWQPLQGQISATLRGEPQLWQDARLDVAGRARPFGWFTYTFTPLRGEDGRVQGVLSVGTETTERVLAERGAADEIARLGSLFAQAPSFMTVLRGPEHRIELANPGYMALVGYREVLGKTVAQALPETVDQGYVALLDEVYRSGKPYFANGAQYSIPLEPGGPVLDRFVDFVFQPIRDAAGAVTGIFVQGVDVTEIRRAERALREADARKNQFVSMLAHELRNPLAPIANALAILDREPAAHIAARMREVVRKQLRHLVRLVDDLLDASRLTLNKVTVSPEPIAVDQLCAEAVEFVRHAIDAKAQRLELDVPASMPPALADRVRIVQVLSNLLNNASKYGHQGGCIRLRAASDGGLVRFDVEDDGTGIDPAFLPRVFDLFAQADSSLDRSAGGLGIGLALVKNLVQLHGGRVDAFSEGPGKGSRFSVWIPMVSGSEASGAG